MMALLLVCTMALDPGVSAALGASKDGTTGATDGAVNVWTAGAANGAADHITATDGAMYEGTVADGAATSDQATGRTVLVVPDGIALGGATATGVSIAGTATVAPAVGDWNISIEFTIPGYRRLTWRLCGREPNPPCKILVSSTSHRCSCWRRWSSRASLALSSTILWTSSYSPILVASSSVTLAAALTADTGMCNTLLYGTMAAASEATLDPVSASAMIRLQCIYNFLCSMLVLYQLLHVLHLLYGTFIHFLRLTY